MKKETNKFPDKTGIELTNLLEGSCDGVVNETYQIALTPEEESSLKDRVVDLSVQRKVIEERKAVVMKEFKEELKPINEELGETLTTVKRGSNLRTGKLYKFVEGHVVSLYDQNGVFVYSRPIREDERQFVIKEQPSTAVNE